MSNIGPTAAQIKAFRKDHGLTQEGFAKLMNASKRAVEEWETDRRAAPAMLHRAMILHNHRLWMEENLAKARLGLEMMESGQMQTRTNNMDTTAESMADLRARIAETEELLASFQIT